MKIKTRRTPRPRARGLLRQPGVSGGGVVGLLLRPTPGVAHDTLARCTTLGIHGPIRPADVRVWGRIVFLRVMMAVRQTRRCCLNSFSFITRNPHERYRNSANPS